jgi:hypothetical protein
VIDEQTIFFASAADYGLKQTVSDYIIMKSRHTT